VACVFFLSIEALMDGRSSWGRRWPVHRRAEAGAAAPDGGAAPLCLVLCQQRLEVICCTYGGESGSVASARVGRGLEAGLWRRVVSMFDQFFLLNSHSLLLNKEAELVLFASKKNK
jgi:hypothetical protein